MTLNRTEPIQSTVVDPVQYRVEVATMLAAGWRFADLHATAGPDAQIRALLTAPDGRNALLSVPAGTGTVPSIVDLTPAAGWDEREARDIYRIEFSGHHPLRPLVDHPDLDQWTVPVRGDGTYQVAVGPVHAGIIESGHFRFHVVGDRILHLDAQLFYKHRGLERAAEGTRLTDATTYVGRLCAACAVANTVAYAHAAEAALGLTPTIGLARARTMLLELERVWNHLNDIAAICAGVGLAAGTMRFAALTERARRLNAAISGHRFLFDTVTVAASNLAIDRDTMAALRAELAALRREAQTSWRELLFNPSLQDRLVDVGTITADQARQQGTVGPAARAAGLTEDVRITSDRLSYPDFKPATTTSGTGDAKARLDQRAVELWQSLDILAAHTDAPVTPAAAAANGQPQPIGVGRVESARGATTCVVSHTAGRLSRLRVRTGSYANWPSVAAAAAGNLLPDFPLINKSFELCYACVDR
jgi:Ni,Fe-hydrogenase III large subunit